MKLKNFSGREHLLLALTIFVAVAVVVYGLIIEPLIIYGARLNNQIESKTRRLIEYRRLLSVGGALTEEHAKFPAFITAEKSEEEALSKVLVEMERVSQKSGCYIVNVKPHSANEVGNYKRISFDIIAEGAISDFSRFLYEIETSPDMLRVRHFTLATKPGSPGKLKGTFLITKIIALQ